MGKRVVSIYISSDSKEVRESAKDISHLSAGLSQLDTLSARQAIENLDKTSLNHLQSEIKDAAKNVKDFKTTDAKRNLDNLDRTNLDKVQSEIKTTSKELRNLANEGNKTKNSLSSAFKGGLIGGAVGGALPEVISQIKQLASDGVKLNASFDKLTRFTTTLDKNFQTPVALKQFQDDIENLSTKIPQDADKIAEASFTIKSAFSEITEPELIDFLRQFGIAATASNVDIATHSENVAALAKQYGITAKELPKFNALIASSFGQALAKDSAVAQGFNEILNTAKATKQPLETLIAAMSTLQGASNNAAGNTTLLKGALEKLSDPKYIEGFEKIGISVFDANRNFRDIGAVINDVAKEIDGLNDEEIAKKFDFFKDQEARQGFLTLARYVQAFNKQISEGGNIEAYNNKTNVMLNATEARWKRFWSSVQNGQRQFGSTMSDYVLSIFDQQTTGAQIEAFFGNLSLLVGKGVTTLFYGVTSLLEGAKFSVYEFFGSDPAESAKAKQGAEKRFNEALLWFDKQKTDFNNNLKNEDLDYFSSIIKNKDASPELQDWAFKQWSALKDGMKSGASQTTEIIKQSGTELQSSLDLLAKNAQISPELRGKLKDEAKKIGDDVKNGISESVPKISAASKDLQAALNKLLGDARISSGLKDAIKKELEGLNKTIVDNKPAINKAFSALLVPDVSKTKESANLLGVNFTNDVANAILNNKQTVTNASGFIITPIPDAAIRPANSMGVAFTTNLVATIFDGKPDVTATVNSLIQTNPAQATLAGRLLGIALGDGVISGINLRKRAAATAVLAFTGGLIGAAKSPQGLDVNSPSKPFIELGASIIEGLIFGVETNTNRAKSAIKKLASETIKEFKDALKDFNKLAGASPEIVQGIQATNRVKDATNKQQEIIALRDKLKYNTFAPLPKTVVDTEKEYADLKRLEEAQESISKANDKLVEDFKDLKAEVEASKKAFAERLQAMQNSGAIELLNLQEQIDLTGIVNESDRERIQNYYDIERLRQEMMNDGYGSAMTEEQVHLLQLQQAQRRELNRILEIRKQVAEATNLGKDLSAQLATLQNGNRELSEYEKTLNKINTDLKDISPAQKEYLLNVASQIDAQKAFNEQYEKTYDFIRGALEILTDSGKSFGDKMKEIFGSVFQYFKKMILDMTAQWLTSKIFGKSGSGGGWFDGILKAIGLGGGSSSSGNSGGFNLGSIFSGNSGNGIFNFGGSNPFSGAGNFGGSSFGSGSNPFASDVVKNISGNSSSKQGKGIGLAEGLQIAGFASQIIGQIVGGRAGSFISNIGQGVAMGAAFGSAVPVIGTAIGAVIGGGIGLLQSILGGDPKRKIDKKENMPKLTQGFADALKQLKELAVNKDSLFNDPQGTLDKALELRAQIASGFGVKMESKHYRQIAQQQIAAKLVEADAIIKDIRTMSDTAKIALDTDARLETNFATGVYMSPAFRKQYGQFKRRNGMLSGTFTGRDTLPSMLAMGEMVLNPFQIARIRQNAGFDVFQNAGIPNYASGTFVSPSPTVSTPSVSASSFNPSPSNGVKQPIIIKLMVNNSGIVESEIKDVLIESLSDSDVQIEVVKTYNKGTSRGVK